MYPRKPGVLPTQDRGAAEGIQDRRLTAAQQKAVNEYVDRWDPYEDPFVVAKAADMDELIARADLGERRPSFVNQLIAHSFDYFGEMKPDSFRKMAKVIVKILVRNAPIPKKIKAAKLALAPINKAAKLMVRIERSGLDTPKQRQLIDHLCACFEAYSETLLKAQTLLKEQGIDLFEIMEKSQTVDHQLQAIETVMGLVLDTMDTIHKLAELRAKKLAIAEATKTAVIDGEVVTAADSEMDEFEQQIRNDVVERPADAPETQGVLEVGPGRPATDQGSVG